MAEMSTKTIPELQMDFAIFVVNANESRLSINEEKAGLGYAKVYRALLQATGKKVIVVIGGDDNYKNEDEEERVVLSRWSRRKVSSQFTEEFMDGRKSFVFSWDKKHRLIHEEALLHYFGKTGLKFDYQPQPKIPVREMKGFPVREMKGFPVREMKDLVILDCNTADESIRAVRQVIEDLRPKLNLSSDPPVVRGTAVELNSYLMMNSVRFCVLVVDAEATKDAYENLPERKKEYQKLLETASEKVEEKVIVTVCGPCSLPPGDEDRVNLAITRILDEKNKGFMVWLKGGKIQVGHEVLLQIMSSIAINRSSNLKASNPAGVGGASKLSSVPCSQDPLRVPPRGGLVRSHSADNSRNVSPFPVISGQHGNLPQGGHVTSFSPGYGGASNVPFVLASSQGGVQPAQGMVTSQSTNQPVAPNGPVFLTPEGERARLLVKAHLRKGKISREEGDIWFQDWEVPEYIRTDLMEKYVKRAEAELLIFIDDKGVLQCRVDPKNPVKTFYQDLGK